MYAVLVAFGWVLAEILVPVFQYLLAIGLVWWSLRRIWTNFAALMVATVAVVGLGFLAPLIANARTERTHAGASDADVLPATPVPLAGDIYLDIVNDHAARSRARPSRFSKPNYPTANTCGRLCRALLATPGVDSVTVEPTHSDSRAAPSPQAVTYRRSTYQAGVSYCGPPARESYDPIDSRVYSGLPTTVCALGGAPVGHVDLRLVATWRSETVPLLKNTFWIQRIELLDGAGRALVRHSRAEALLTAVPFRLVLHASSRDPLMVKTKPSARDGDGGPLPRPGEMLLARTTIAHAVG